MTTRFTLNVTSDNIDQEGKGLSQNATMMSDNPDDIIAALSQLAGVNRASNNYGAQDVDPNTGCGCVDERVEEEYANEPDPVVYSAAGGVGDMVDTGHTAKAKNRYTKAGFGDNPLAETDDEEEGEDEWYDKDGRPDPNGAFDAGGHYYPERDNRYDEAEEERMSALLMREWTEDKLQSVSQEFDVDAAMAAIFEGKEEFRQGTKQFVVRKDADVVKVFPLMENRTIMTMPLLVLDAAALVKEAEVAEKAVSQAQQQAAGAALAAKRGDAPKSELKGASKEMMSMSTAELEKFAGTKHKGLPKHVGEDTVSEDQESVDAVAGAITRRIMMQHTDILSKYGPVKVMAAIDDVAQFAGGDGLDEIGSSDVSIWTKQVIQDLEAGHYDRVEEELAEEQVEEGDFVSTLGAIAAARYQPKEGDKIRTRKGGQIPGTVEKVGEVGGIEYCWFRHPEGKLYKTPCSNVMREDMDEAKGDITVKDVSAADAFKKHTGQADVKHDVPKDPKTGKTLFQKMTDDVEEGMEPWMGKDTDRPAADRKKEYEQGKEQGRSPEDRFRDPGSDTPAWKRKRPEPKTENIEVDEELQQIMALAGMHEAKVDEEGVDENAYNQAAAAAARSGAKEFEFPKGSGKMHPTKMDKATAHQMGEAEESEDEDKKMDEAKPDFLDIDGDGDREESMKDAADDKEEKVDEDADFDYMMSLLNKWR